MPTFLPLFAQTQSYRCAERDISGGRTVYGSFWEAVSGVVGAAAARLRGAPFQSRPAAT